MTNGFLLENFIYYYDYGENASIYFLDSNDIFNYFDDFSNHKVVVTGSGLNFSSSGHFGPTEHNRYGIEYNGDAPDILKNFIVNNVNKTVSVNIKIYRGGN